MTHSTVDMDNTEKPFDVIQVPEQLQSAERRSGVYSVFIEQPFDCSSEQLHNLQNAVVAATSQNFSDDSVTAFHQLADSFQWYRLCEDSFYQQLRQHCDTASVQQLCRRCFSGEISNYLTQAEADSLFTALFIGSPENPNPFYAFVDTDAQLLDGDVFTEAAFELDTVQLDAFQQTVTLTGSIVLLVHYEDLDEATEEEVPVGQISLRLDLRVGQSFEDCCSYGVTIACAPAQPTTTVTKLTECAEDCLSVPTLQELLCLQELYAYCRTLRHLGLLPMREQATLNAAQSKTSPLLAFWLLSTFPGIEFLRKNAYAFRERKNVLQQHASRYQRFIDDAQMTTTLTRELFHFFDADYFQQRREQQTAAMIQKSMQEPSHVHEGEDGFIYLVPATACAPTTDCQPTSSSLFVHSVGQEVLETLEQASDFADLLQRPLAAEVFAVFPVPALEVAQPLGLDIFLTDPPEVSVIADLKNAIIYLQYTISFVLAETQTDISEEHLSLLANLALLEGQDRAVPEDLEKQRQRFLEELCRLPPSIEVADDDAPDGSVPGQSVQRVQTCELVLAVNCQFENLQQALSDACQYPVFFFEDDLGNPLELTFQKTSFIQDVLRFTEFRSMYQKIQQSYDTTDDLFLRQLFFGSSELGLFRQFKALSDDFFETCKRGHEVTLRLLRTAPEYASAQAAEQASPYTKLLMRIRQSAAAPQAQPQPSCRTIRVPIKPADYFRQLAFQRMECKPTGLMQ